MSGKLLHLGTAAIDFGTAFSGYAFSFTANPDDVKQNHNWGQELGFSSSKAPTCIVLNGNGQFKGFGYDAQDLYTNYDPDESEEKLFLYHEFKMCLYRSSDELGEDTEIEAVGGGQKCKAMTIFKMALEFLKDHMLKTMKQAIANAVSEQELQWVITVPAIWSDGAKQFMRRCAMMAGIISDEHSKQLLIALEPEAASLFCRDMCVEDIKKNHNVPESSMTTSKEEGKMKQQRVTIHPGTRYMVVDSGGGTVDITAHDYKQNKDLCELFAASGGDWGGTNVNRNFEKVLKELLGEDVVETFITEDTPSYMGFKIQFEVKKRSVDFEGENYKLSMSVPYALDGMCHRVKKKPLQKIIASSNLKGVKFSNGLLIFSKEILDQIFKPVVERITEHIGELLDKPELQGIRYIFLVGGFSDCSCLQLEMKRHFQTENRKIILSPNDASLSIVKGAVKFGYNPKAITSRCVRYTYGTDIYEMFNSKTHTKDKQVEAQGGKKYCRDVFHKFVVKNEEVTPEDVRCHSFQALHSGQNVLSVKMFIAYQDDVKYVTDKQVSKHPANIRIELTNRDGRAHRQIKVYLYFGSTEIHVEALDESKPGNKSQKATVNFLQ